MISNKYDEVWNQLELRGYEQSDCVSYFDFVESIEDVGYDVEDIDLELMEEYYNITIG